MSDDHIMPRELPAAWRQRAEFLPRFGDPNSARLWLTAAAKFERAFAAHGAQMLTLNEAAAVSGYTAGYLGDLIADGLRSFPPLTPEQEARVADEARQKEEWARQAK